MTRDSRRSSVSTPAGDSGPGLATHRTGSGAGRGRLDTTQAATVHFTLPSSGEQWNWPVEGWDAINALAEILDRANIPWRVRLSVEPKR